MPVSAILLLLATGNSPVTFQHVLTVRPADIQPLHFSVKNKPATLDLEFRVSKPEATVRVIILPQGEEQRLRSNRQYVQLAASEFLNSGKMRTYVPTPGEYLIVVDNRHQANTQLRVELNGRITYDVALREARYLSSTRRFVVIASTLAFFFGVSWIAGRKLWAATLGQRRPGPPPPYV